MWSQNQMIYQNLGSEGIGYEFIADNHCIPVFSGCRNGLTSPRPTESSAPSTGLQHLRR